LGQALTRSRNCAAQGMSSPDDWARMLDRPPILHAEAGWRNRVVIRRWRDTPPEVRQPRLDHHYVVLHLGGPKRVRRRGDTAEQVVEMDRGALSLVSVGSAYEWRTEGAIDYAHIYMPPERLAAAATDLCRRDAGGIELVNRVGVRDELLRQLFEALLAEVAGEADSLYVDTLYNAFLARLLVEHSSLNAAMRTAPVAIAPRRLAAVIDHVDANLAGEVSLADLAAVAQLSPFHFARAFAQTTGRTPHAYVMDRRLDAAKRLLRESPLSIATISERCGFASASHLSSRFRKVTGFTPTDFRRRR
jgi:AraC family transcriptional regulator